MYKSSASVASDDRGIECCVEPKQRNMDDSNTVEVHEQMPGRMLLVMSSRGRGSSPSICRCGRNA